MKKTVKLSEQDLNRIVKRIIKEEQENQLFGSESGDIYHDVMNEIEGLSNENFMNNIIKKIYDYSDKVKNLHDKIIFELDLPSNKKEELRLAITNLHKKQIEELKKGYDMFRSL